MVKKNSKKNTGTQKTADTDNLKYLTLITFILLAVLIFYPPYFRGLFFSEEMFVTHVITAIIFILVWVRKLLTRDYRFLDTPLDWAILAYAGAYLLSLFGAVHISDAVYGFMKALNYFMIYWMVTAIVKDFRDYDKVLKILVASGLGVALIGILAAVGWVHYQDAYLDYTILSTLQYPNATANYLSVLILIALALLNLQKKLYQKIVLLIIGYIMLLVVFCTLSKGAWLILAAGALLLLVGMPANIRLKTAYNFGIILLAAVATYTWFYPAITTNQHGRALVSLLIGIVLLGLGLAFLKGMAYLKTKSKALPMLISGVIVLLIVSFGYHYLSTNGQHILVKGNNVFTSLKNPAGTSISDEIKGISNSSNSSYVIRYDMMRWGMAIVKDHPIVGAGAGGWNALYHQYQDKMFWATEVHNHFLQVWIEAGTIGLIAFLSIWLLMIWTVVRIRRQLIAASGAETNERWILIWVTFCGATVMGLHAAIDFDLSLGSMCILLWVLFALVDSAGRITDPTKAAQLNRSRIIFNGGLAIVISLVMLIAGTSYAIAAFSAEKADNAMVAMAKAKDAAAVNSEFDLALRGYEKAVGYDSLNANYKAKLSYAYSMQWKALSGSDPMAANQIYQKTIDLIDQALELRPYDTDLDNILIKSISNLGNLDRMLKVSRYAIKTNPYDAFGYDLYAQALGKGMEFYKNNNNDNKAREMATELIKVESMVEKQKKIIDPNNTMRLNGLSDYSKGYLLQAHQLLDQQ
ncbi:MAG: O-antigen ligase family protein [Syntrophomonadaceae bacterium]|nr:O-antigen ligase family protein [Syntrophomonadaceae bacterium]